MPWPLTPPDRQHNPPQCWCSVPNTATPRHSNPTNNIDQKNVNISIKHVQSLQILIDDFNTIDKKYDALLTIYKTTAKRVACQLMKKIACTFVSCGKYWIYWEDVNTKFTKWHLFNSNWVINGNRHRDGRAKYHTNFYGTDSVCPLQSLKADRIRYWQEIHSKGNQSIHRTSVWWVKTTESPDSISFTQDIHYLIIIWIWRIQCGYCTIPPIGCWFRPRSLCTANQRRVKLFICVDNFSNRCVVPFSRYKVLRTVNTTTRKLQPKRVIIC